MSIKAKFECNSIVDTGHNLFIHLSAVYGTEGENADYSKATPCGNLSLNVDKDTKAATYFKRGSYYYLNFEEVEQQ